jgi:hypothetical protein
MMNVTSEQLQRNALYLHGMKHVHVDVSEAELIIDEFILKVLSGLKMGVAPSFYTHWEVYYRLGCDRDSPLFEQSPKAIEFIVYWRMHMMEQLGFVYRKNLHGRRIPRWGVT